MSIIFKDVKSIQTPMGFLKEIKRSDGLILWRSGKDIVGHTTVTLDPTEFDLGTSNKLSVEYNERPDEVTVVYREGETSKQLTKDTDYTLTYENDSGWIRHNDEGEVLSTAYAVIDGKGDYFGQVKQGYIVKHTYKKDLSVTVTFDGNEGSTPIPEQRLVTVGKAYGDLATTSRTNYDFTGWYTQKTEGSKITKDTEVTNKQDHILYAHWSEKTKYVHYLWVNVDGKDTIAEYSTYVTKAYCNNKQMTEDLAWYSAPATYEAYLPFSVDINTDICQISGWSEVGKTSPNPGSASLSSDQDYMAPIVWVNTSRTYTVVFSPGDGSGSMDSQTIQCGQKTKLNKCTFGAPSGKSFNKWNDDSGGNSYDDEEEVIDIASPGQTVQLEATWRGSSQTLPLTIGKDKTGTVVLEPGKYKVFMKGGKGGYATVGMAIAPGGACAKIQGILTLSQRTTLTYKTGHNGDPHTGLQYATGGTGTSTTFDGMTAGGGKGGAVGPGYATKGADGTASTDPTEGTFSEDTSITSTYFFYLDYK